MGKCSVSYDEIRIDVRDPEITKVWVYISMEGDCPHQIQGWHHRCFPARFNMVQIIEGFGTKDGDPVMWPRQAPPK
jgi:hypothetical protein